MEVCSDHADESDRNDSRKGTPISRVDSKCSGWDYQKSTQDRKSSIYINVGQSAPHCLSYRNNHTRRKSPLCSTQLSSSDEQGRSLQEERGCSNRAHQRRRRLKFRVRRPLGRRHPIANLLEYILSLHKIEVRIPDF